LCCFQQSLSTPLIRFGEFFHKVDEVVVLRDHECAHGDLFPAALHGLVKRLVNDSRIESEGILIETPCIIKNGRRFSIRNHEDLLVDVAAYDGKINQLITDVGVYDGKINQAVVDIGALTVLVNQLRSELVDLGLISGAA